MDRIEVPGERYVALICFGQRGHRQHAAQLQEALDQSINPISLINMPTCKTAGDQPCWLAEIGLYSSFFVLDYASGPFSLCSLRNSEDIYATITITTGMDNNAVAAYSAVCKASQTVVTITDQNSSAFADSNETLGRSEPRVPMMPRSCNSAPMRCA